MITLLTAITLAAGPADTARLAVGDTLPGLEGRTLSGQRVTLPEVAGGRIALVALGFSYASRIPVEAWAERFRERYGGDTTLVLYEVPMIGGLGRMAGFFIDRGMRRGTPRELHDFVVTVYGDTRPWQRRLGVDDRDTAHLVLLGSDGRVAWTHSGSPEPDAVEEMARTVERLRSARPARAP